MVGYFRLGTASIFVILRSRQISYLIIQSLYTFMVDFLALLLRLKKNKYMLFSFYVLVPFDALSLFDPAADVTICSSSTTISPSFMTINTQRSTCPFVPQVDSTSLHKTVQRAVTVSR